MNITRHSAGLSLSLLGFINYTFSILFPSLSLVKHTQCTNRRRLYYKRNCIYYDVMNQSVPTQPNPACPISIQSNMKRPMATSLRVTITFFLKKKNDNKLNFLNQHYELPLTGNGNTVYVVIIELFSFSFLSNVFFFKY